MQTIRVIFTSRLLNPISWLIRWTLPQSRFKIARSSHSIVVDGDHIIEAHMIYGVRRVPLHVALKGAKIVHEATYPVEDAERGLSWYRSQICTFQPNPPKWLPSWARKIVGTVQLVLNNNYDFKGAFGLGLAPDRNWQSPENWHCYEGAARTLKEAGLDVFSKSGFITETTLLAVKQVD